jgi:sec-independent protein translocase protein TatC
MAEQSGETRDPHDVAVDTDEQPFLDHLIELRSRILRSVAVVGVIFVPIYYFANDLYEWVSAPLTAQLPEGSTMIATQVATPFLTPFKLAIFAAIFVGVPYLLHQLWAFVSPGLYRHEKKFAVPLLLSSILLFYAGMAFVYFLVFPLIFAFFTQVAPEGVAIMTDINQYLDFVLKMFLAFGLAFEIPIATMLMAWSGLATADTMARKRPYVIVGCFVVGMLLTPPDVISQLLLALPTWLLFEVGVIMARLTEKETDSSAE